MRSAFVLCCGLVVAAVGGCGRSGPERVVVSGTVTYQGKPVEDGQIRFVPAKGTEAPMSGGPIKDGKYAVDMKGGVPVGTHKVQILAHRFPPESLKILETLPPDATELEMPPREQYIPKKYNVNTTLEITIPSGSGKINRDFELTD